MGLPSGAWLSEFRVRVLVLSSYVPSIVSMRTDIVSTQVAMYLFFLASSSWCHALRMSTRTYRP